MSNLVTFDQKQVLRKLGYDFDSICFCGGAMDCICEHLPDENKLITVSSALDLVRDEKGIYCGVYPFMWGYKGIAIVQGDYNPYTIYFEPLSTHHLASSALLDAVLTYLEQKEKK